MAGRGGARPGAGRPKGSVNVRTIGMKDRIIRSGEAPLDVTVAGMRYWFDVGIGPGG